jgi:hypothetical protein
MSLLLLHDGGRNQALQFNSPLRALPASLISLGATYTRNSPKHVVDAAGTRTFLSANQFGTTFDSVTGLYGYTAEPAATNMEVSSEGNVASATGSNVTDGALATFDAAIVYGDNSVERSLYRSLTVTAQRYSWSTYIVMDDGGAPVIGSTNTTGDFSIIVAGVIGTANVLVFRLGNSNVYRVSAANPSNATAGSQTFGLVKYTGQSARTFKIAGRQAETGTRATSYIKTTGVTAARAADVLEFPTANIPGFSAAGYTLWTDSRFDVPFGAGTAGRRLSVDDASANNVASITVNSAAQQSVAVVSGGVTVSSYSQSVGTARSKFAVSCAANSFLSAADGVAGAGDTSGAMPVSPTTVHVGCRYDNAAQCNHIIYGFAIIPVAYSQAQLNGITTL